MTEGKDQQLAYLLEKVAYLEDTLELSMQEVAQDIKRLEIRLGDMDIALYEIKINVENKLVSEREMSKEHFEVEHYTLLNGWINCWTTYDENDNESPTRYDKFEDALSGLDELFDEIEAEIVSGYREPDMRYNDSDYRIVKFVSGVMDNVYPYTYLPPPRGNK